jgi:psiF repeat
MTLSKTLGVAFTALMLSAGISMADPAASTTATAVKPATTTTAAAKPVKIAKHTAKHMKVAKLRGAHGKFAAKSEMAQECSAKADTQGLHGKARRHFRKDCMKTAKLSSPAAVKAHHTKTASVKPVTTAH